MSQLAGKRILLIVAGGVAAYKSLLLIRLLRSAGASVRCVLTQGGAEFITPLSLAALSEDKVYTDLFSLTDEAEMGHIQLSRDADLLVVAPATADLLARMAAGMADDLAATVLLATDKPVLVAPAMNVRMWEHPATQANIATLQARGVASVGPEIGPMACNETGPGRMAEPEALLAAIEAHFLKGCTPPPLAGRTALVTAGPTVEPIDPVRFLSNRSSGKQGFAIAAALGEAGAEVTLVAGPVSLPTPAGVRRIDVETAEDMAAEVAQALPAHIAICTAAVADWRPERARPEKWKKGDDSPPSLALVENPDILAGLARPGPARPDLVIGFAAETDNLLENARAKRLRKGCDWIVANAVGGESLTFGGDRNSVHLIREEGEESWDNVPKVVVAQLLVERIIEYYRD